MNIFHKIALQGLLRNRTRTLVTIIGVVLSAALLTGVMSFGISLLDYMARGAAEVHGGWHIAFFDVPDSFVQARKSDASVLDAATTVNIGYAPFSESEDPDKPYLFIAGYDEKAFQTLPVNLLSGRLPENDREVVVSGGLQLTSGGEIREGCELTLELGDRTRDGLTLSQHDRYDPENETFTPRETRIYTVVGFCQRPQYEPSLTPGFTLITRIDPNGADGSRNVFVTLNDPIRISAYEKETEEGYVSARNDDVLRFRGLSDDRMFTSLLLAVGGVVIAIIMIGSIFLIHNAFNISLNERTHQFGILLSVGATEKQLRGSVLFEGLCIGAAGIPVGMLLGLAAIRAVIAAVARNFQGILYSSPLALVVSPPAVALAAAIALVTILISAYIPAKKAAAVPVMDCIRQTGEIKVEAKAVKVSRFAERALGLEAILALKNFRRNRKRYRSIVLSLVLSVVLFVSTNAFVIDLQQASEAAVVFTTLDLALAMPTVEDDELVALFDRLKEAQGVASGDYQEVRRYVCTIPAEDCTDELRAELGEADAYPLDLLIQFLDDDTWREKLAEAGLTEADLDGAEPRLICTAKIQNLVNRVLMPEEFVDMFRAGTLDTEIAAKYGDGEQTKAVGLTFVNLIGHDSPTVGEVEQTPYFFIALAPWSQKAAFDALGAPAEGKGMTFRSDTPSGSEAEMLEMLRETPPTVSYTFWNMSRMTESNTNMIFIANVFAYTFIVMVSLIAVANVFNTISTNIRLRRRELAMLRSVGMSERSFQKMMNFECAFYGLQTLLFGVPLSMLLSWLIYRGMYAGGADAIDFILPWGAIAVSAASVLLIVFVTMLYAVSSIKRENIIDALRDDLA